MNSLYLTYALGNVLIIAPLSFQLFRIIYVILLVLGRLSESPYINVLLIFCMMNYSIRLLSLSSLDPAFYRACPFHSKPHIIYLIGCCFFIKKSQCRS